MKNKKIICFDLDEVICKNQKKISFFTKHLSQ